MRVSGAALRDWNDSSSIVNFTPDPGVDHDLAERNIQILCAAAVSGGLFVLLDRGEFRGQEFPLIGIMFECISNLG